MSWTEILGFLTGAASVLLADRLARGANRIPIRDIDVLSTEIWHNAT